ncbi:serine hydrolase-like protein [Eucyclogobius newberryi]|uniref:serine hydrolase-like protein n=1 Tax=Eucyclogobius newberryi TaxID=166745 RepID=UPI003B5A7C9C
MTSTVSELFVPVPWGEIRGRVWGPRQGYPVLCLHGWADNCGSFNTLIPLLPRDYRYVAIDLSGHGLSSHHPPGVFYHLLSYVADVRRVVESLQMTRFSIIGHSMGGHIAGLFSALYPEMVDALVLLDAKPFVVTDVRETASKMRQGVDEILQFEMQSKKKKVYTYEKALERLLAAIPITKQSAQILLERGLVSVEGGFAFSRDLRVNFKSVVRVSLEQSLQLLSKTRARVLIILAEHGSFEKTLASTIQHFQERNHMCVTVQGDHHVHLNNSQHVAPFISTFLQTNLSPPSAKL